MSPLHGPGDRRWLRRALWWTGLVMIVGPILVGWSMLEAPTGTAHAPLHLGTIVLGQAQAWCLVMVAGIGCWTACLVLLARHGRLRRSRRGLLIAVPRTVVSVICTLTVGICVPAVWLFSDTYHVLSPAGPGGCRIVSAHDNVAMVGDYNRIWILRSSRPLLQPTGLSYDFDSGPGIDPVQEGTFHLAWAGRTGSLSMWEPPQYQREDQPSTPSVVSCDR